MKKRIFILSIALILVLVCLAACNTYQAKLDEINKLLKVSYSKVEITVTTEKSGVTLNGEYTLTFDGTKTLIDYKYEELNELSMNGDNAMKKTWEGTAVVQNGVVVSNSQEVNLNTQQLDFTGLSFKTSFFGKATATSGEFNANVKTPKGFLGYSDFSGSNMHVKVTYSTESISEIILNYTSANGAKIEIVYQLTV